MSRIRFVATGAASIALFLLVGCGPKPNDKADGKKDRDEKAKPAIPAQTVKTSAGNTIAKGPVSNTNPKIEPKWYVEWKEATIDVATEDGKTGVASGAMDGVSGHLFADGRPSSTFTADGAMADRTKQTLILKGHVHVISPKPQAELTCDRIVYDAKAKVIQAQGHVQVVGKVGTIGTLSEVLATPDLTLVATPDMFKAK